jgi:hypothetical protein
MANRIILTADELRALVAADVNFGDWTMEGLLVRRDDKSYKFFPTKLSYEQFKYIYRRMGIARNAVNKWVSALWDKWFTVKAKSDKVKEEVEQLNRRLRVKQVFKKATRYMRQYGYGLVYIGVADQEPSEPLGKISSLDKVFLKALSPLNLKDAKYDGTGEEFELVEDTSNPRYGEPEFYNVVVGTNSDGVEEVVKVHWTRVIHLVDPEAEDQLRGVSVFEPAFDTLLILKNVDWAAGESYYQNASPLFVLSYEGELSEQELEQMKRDLEEINVKSRYIKPKNFELDTVRGSGQAPDPNRWWQPLLRRVAGELGVPERVLYGMPKGALAAAETDLMQWYGEIAQLQKDFCEYYLDEFYRRLHEAGVLSVDPDEFEYEWTPLWELDEIDKARVWQIKSAAAARLQGDPTKGIPAIMTPEEIRKFIFELEGEPGEAVTDVFFRPLEAEERTACNCGCASRAE